MPLHMGFRHFFVSKFCIANLTGESIIVVVLLGNLCTRQPATGSKLGVGIARSNFLVQLAFFPISLACAPFIKENLELVMTSLTSGHQANLFFQNSHDEKVGVCK